MGDWEEEDFSTFEILPLFNKTTKPSFVWRYFGDLVLEKAGKKKKMDTNRVYCRTPVYKEQ